MKESLDDRYPKALEGFLIILSQDSDIIYVSDNVAKYLGIAQVKSYFCEFFYAPGLKGPPGASSNRIVRPFVSLYVRLSVSQSIIPSLLQTKCNI